MDLIGLMHRLNEYGPPGLFLVSFISNAIPGFPAIYLTFIGTYAAVVEDPAGGILAVVLSGVGAGLGKLFVFLSSRTLAGLSEAVRRKREEARWIVDEAGKGIFIMVFLFAALPLPDDLLYIPLGLTGYRIFSFAAAVILGKIVLTAMAYLLGRAYRSAFERFLAGETGVNMDALFAGIIVGTVIVSAIVLAMDWRRIYEAYRSRGPLHGLAVMLLEVLRILSFGLIGSPARPAAAREAVIVTVLAAATGALVGAWHGKALGATAGVLAWIAYSGLIQLARRGQPRKPPADEGDGRGL